MSEDEPPGDGDPMEQLRELLVGPERKDLADLRRIVTDPSEKTREISRILPHAIRLSSSHDAQLSQSLAPTIESALKESVKKDPSVLTDVVFPIIGPAIRRAIADAFSKMVQSLNQTMEHSLSVQGFKWRFEAKRTGKSFAEIVMSRTLVYRVEQVFLIHKETGLLLAHAEVPNAPTQDADMISGMLTAIQDFMRDAFKAEGAGLRSTQYGDYNVWLETSRHLTLAAFIRGTAPEDFRTTMQDALERITIEQGAALVDFQGDAAPFEEARPVLEDCLRVQLAERSGKTSPLLWIAPLLLVLGFAALWEWRYIRGVEKRVAEERLQVEAEQKRHAYHREQREAQQRLREDEARRQEASVVEEAQIAKCLQQLNAQPGLVVTDVSRRDGVIHFTGLRDALASDPQAIIAASGLAAGKVQSHWENYYALHPAIIVKRAAQRLAPPPTVALALRGETLVATGGASAKWVADARARAEAIPGVAAFDASGVVDETLAFLLAKKKEIEGVTFLFQDGSDFPPDEQENARGLAAVITAFHTAASKSGRRAHIIVTGHTTDVGGEAFNLKLSRARAESVVAALVASGVDATALTPVGVAARAPKFTDPADSAKNRCVTFTADFEEAPPNPAPR